MKMNIDFDYIKKFIENNNLNLATHREMPLFTLSCISIGYSKMKKYLGYSYENIAAIGGEGKFNTMFNEPYIILQTEKLIEKNMHSLDNLAFVPANKIANKVMKKITKCNNISPEDCLKIITEIYDEYMSSIAIYNCFWRYIGNDKNKGKLSSELVSKIGKERDFIAKIYPIIEKKIIDCVKSIGDKNNFDGDILRYFTLDEMKNYLANFKLETIQKNELENRRKGYFYMYTEEPFSEVIITNEIILKKIKDIYLSFNKNIDSFKGYPAYGGKVSGEVYNLKNHPKNEIEKISRQYILVSSMTKPEDIDIIRKSKAIITDEGGILSHAAINSREFKIPCIIGTKFASSILDDGDLVEVDADKGVVKILKKAN